MDVDEIVRGLSEAQRRAMSTDNRGKAYVHAWNTQSFDALERRGLADREYGNTGHLTPLGLAVRARLLEQDHG